MPDLKRTPLCDRHQALGAKMVPFAGWLMPVSFSGIQQEHFSVRQKAGIFDVSHMGLVRVSGEGALAFVQNISVNDAALLHVGASQYSAMCYPNGTCVDDIYVNRTGENEFHIVVNAGCKEKDLQWMNDHILPGVEITRLDTGILAVQGPVAVDIICQLFGSSSRSMVKNSSSFVEYAGQCMLMTRTGYTGEDGFEVFPPNALLGTVYDALLAVDKSLGLVPCGLGCRDTLRLECGFSLYGHELNDTTNLVEAGLSWIVGWDKADFIGAHALRQIKAHGPSRKLVGLRALDKALPRDGFSVFWGDKEVGRVTSGGLSPMLNRGVALAYVETDCAVMGREVQVLIRDQKKLFQIVSRRFIGGK